MDPLGSATAGDWLKPLIDTQWRDMHAVVPRGFPAYARIFHPVERDRPQDSQTWHGQDLATLVATEQQKVSWSDVALAYGKQMHALAQFGRLLGPDTPMLGPLDAAGWRYSSPDTGNLEPGTLAAVASHLCAHTSTPEKGVTGVWEGHTGLTSSAGYAQLTIADGGVQKHYAGGAAMPSAEPGTGLLPADVVNGDKLELLGRSYYLFDTATEIYTETGWISHAPWNHSPSWPQSPNLLWPADRSWVLVSEIDFDSTVVAGSWELISALTQDPSIEALVLREGADLSWDADIPNRPLV